MKGTFKRFTIIAMMLLMASFILSACGSSQSSTTTKNSGSTGSKQTTTTKATDNTTKTSTQSDTTATSNNVAENVYMVIEPGAKLGPDGKMHDAYINGDIKITKGQKVTLNILNYDGGTHTYTSPDLGLNIKVKGSSKKGVPALTQYTFTPGKEGTFNWFCADPCDGEAGGWAMSHDGYMKGKITVLPSTNKTQYVSLVVNAGIKLGPDGKMHDSYTPGDVTVKAGQPVQLTVYNFDDGAHSFSAPKLNLDLKVKGGKKGVPSVSTATFTPKEVGKYQWNCLVTCDGEAGHWAMSHDGYMMGSVNVIDSNSTTATQTTTTNTTATTSDVAENVYMMIGKGVKKGSDGKMHDAYVNGDIKITKGQKVTLNIYNYDDMEHTYTSPDLGLNIKAKGASKDGKPGVTSYTFTPKKAGTFNWYCADPCDDEAGGWAMTHNGFMKGSITVLPSTNKTQYVSLVVNAGIKLGPDGKMHDAYTPGDITVKAGQPVQLTVYNFDDGGHSFTAPKINLDLKVKGGKKGVPSVQTATFTPKTPGKYQWNCLVTCDGEAGHWAMSHDGYMMGYVTVK